MNIDFKQATELLQLFGGEPAEIALMTGGGYSGHGLYAIYTADLDEGSVYLGETDENATPRIAQTAPVAAIEPKETKTKTVWVAWTNTDLTEGRGGQYPLVVCDSQTTAVRLGAKKYVMGSDCPVDAQTAVLIGHKWLIPGIIHPPSAGDTKHDEQRAEKSAALQRLKNAGVSDADLKLLGAI